MQIDVTLRVIMLSIANKTIILVVTMMSVTMLSVIVLSVAMLSIVVPMRTYQ